MDELLDNYQVEEGGLLGTITHLGDGDVPQDAIAMIGGEETDLERSRLANWVEG